jgi:VWFA-related protein
MRHTGHDAHGRSRRLLVLVVWGVGALATGFRSSAQPPAPPQAPVFRSGVNLVLVDVVVKDKKGAMVRNLMANDFELREDGVRQQILTFAFEEVGANPALLAGGVTLAAAATAKPSPPPAAERTPTDAGATKPVTSEDVAGHRLITIVFDTSSMQPEDVQRAIDSATTWVDDHMSSADLIAVATIGTRLRVLTDFTSSKDTIRAVLSGLSSAEGTAFAAVDTSTAATDAASVTATGDSTPVDQSAQELDTFNNDVRLRALKTLADALKPVQQKKAIVYFSSGMQRNGTDNQVELRAAVNASVMANVAIYPVDARGLQAVIPGGEARQASQGGLGAFTGGAVTNQFTQLASEQETLTTLASDTGGKAFTDTNDLGEAFARVTQDISAYYILGFASTNPAQDGRFRRITVRLRNKSDLKVEARDGYYADRDFAHTAKRDREAALQDQLTVQIPATDVPLFVTSGWFRLSPDRYYVPVTLAVPGSAVPRSPDKTTLDVAGFIADERGFPVGRIRDTLTVPPAGADSLASRQVLYQTGVTLPPGRFTVKVVVRENLTGQMGTFETRIAVPELKIAPVKVSSLVLSTQLQNAPDRRTPNPLIRDGVELVPNLTHIVGRDQKLYFYYEVYDPAVESGEALLRTNLAFYRGRVKVFETPVVERTDVDARDRHASIFQFEIPPASLRPGLYTCQVNIIDRIAGRFAFSRLELYVR